MKWKTEQKILLNLNNEEKIDVKEKEQTLKDLWTYNKRSNIHVIGKFVKLKSTQRKLKIFQIWQKTYNYRSDSRSCADPKQII